MIATSFTIPKIFNLPSIIYPHSQIEDSKTSHHMADNESPASQGNLDTSSHSLPRRHSGTHSDATTAVASIDDEDNLTSYWSARGSISSSSIFSTSTGLQSQLGATWRQAMRLTMNSGFASGAPRTEGYKGVREGRETGALLPRIKGVGRTGKGPAKVPREMVEAVKEAWQIQRIEERVREMKFVRAADFAKAIQRGFEQVQTLDDLDSVEGQTKWEQVVKEVEFENKLKAVIETLTNLEHYCMEHASVAKKHSSDVVAGNWRLNGAKLGELEERLIFLLRNKAKEKEPINHALAEVEYFRARRIEWDEAQAESSRLDISVIAETKPN